MTSDFRALVRRQLELEDDSRALGARRYQSRDLPWKTDGGSADEEAFLPPGRALTKGGHLADRGRQQRVPDQDRGAEGWPSP